MWPHQPHYLVFEKDSSEAGGNETLNGSLDVHGVTVTVVGVADDGDGEGLSDEAALVDHFAVGDESGVGEAQSGGGDGEAAGDAVREAGGLDELGAESVETGGALVNTWGLHDSPKHLRRFLSCCSHSLFSSPFAFHCWLDFRYLLLLRNAFGWVT